MKLFRFLLLCLVLAVLGALLWRWYAADQGQVIVTLHGVVYTTTATKALVILFGALLMSALALWLLSLPFRMWSRHRNRQARMRIAGGMLALHEGRWTRAEKFLAQASVDPALRLPARLGAAQAARARGDAAAAEQHLQAAGREDGDAAITLARADALLDAGRAQDAIAMLDAAALKTPLSPRALLVRIRALAASRRSGEAYGALGALRSAQALSADDHATLEAELAAQSLREASDANALADRWDRLLVPLRARSEVVAAYAQRAVELGMEDAGASAIDTALKNRWSEELALQYGRLPPGRMAATQPNARLLVAEGWLRAHSDSPALGVTLGRLYREQQQWGKAEDALHRAIAQGAGADAWEELGNVYVAQTDEANSRLCFANALRAARGEAVEAMPGRGFREQIFDASVVEERSDHGVPRLPG
jgi:HemY protein